MARPESELAWSGMVDLSGGNAHEQRYQRQLYRAHGRDRIGLRQQQLGLGRRNPEPDQSGARGIDAGLGRPERRHARAAETGDLGEKVDYARLSRLPRGWKEVQV